MARNREEHNTIRCERLQAKGVVSEDINFARTDYLGEVTTQCCLCDTSILYNYVLMFVRPDGHKIIFEPVGSECITDWAEAMPASAARDTLLLKIKDIKTKLTKEKQLSKAFAFIEENKLIERYAACEAAHKDFTLKHYFKGGIKTIKQGKFFLELLIKYEAYPQNKKSNNICDCKAPMVLRTGTYGKFWGCSTFPRCRFIKKYEIQNETQNETTSLNVENPNELPFELPKSQS